MLVVAAPGDGQADFMQPRGPAGRLPRLIALQPPALGDLTQQPAGGALDPPSLSTSACQRAAMSRNRAIAQVFMAHAPQQVVEQALAQRPADLHALDLQGLK